MGMKLRRGMVRELGPGFAVTNANGNPMPGRWPTYQLAYDEGFLGVYLLSGVSIVELVAKDGVIVEKKRWVC